MDYLTSSLGQSGIGFLIGFMAGWANATLYRIRSRHDG